MQIFKGRLQRSATSPLTPPSRIPSTLGVISSAARRFEPLVRSTSSLGNRQGLMIEDLNLFGSQQQLDSSIGSNLTAQRRMP